MIPGVSAGNNGSAEVSVNFGQMDFIYTVPTGAKKLQTNNLPEPTIKNGSDHFQAITGPGQGYLVYNEGGDSNPDPQQAAILTDLVGGTPTGGFMTSSVIYDMGAPVTSAAPGFQGSAGYWVTAGTPAYQPITTLVSLDGSANSWTQVDEGTYTAAIDHFINISTTTPFRYVRMRKNTINNNLALAGNGFGGILGTAQNTFPNGLWWIKDRVNSNQHQLVDSVRGTTNQTIQNPGGGYTNAYSAPSGNSVAWCWKYNSSDVSENGFNIIEFTGADDDPQTIDTGLTNPQFVIYASDSSSGIRAQHASYQPGLLEFNTSSQGVGYSACTFSGGNVNIDGALIGGSGVMYAWEPVEGFSKFGSYTGNGNADGTFVYLGFKPALIILKSSTDAFDWQIYDSTRSPTNPALLTLRPNQTASEVTSGNDLDILSNGFKARDNGSINNNSGSTYLYMAFAESPFGGENAPPATAR
jgi:hypothetical protein